MWVCLNDAFLSIVKKDCARDELLVRARRKGDIERIFPRATVERTPKADYLYRASVAIKDISDALALEVTRITYSNFKDSVKEHDLHNAYLKVWTAMCDIQPSGGAYHFKTTAKPAPMPKTKPRRPKRTAPSAKIMEYIRAIWTHSMWGFGGGCDRCPDSHFAADHPCGHCKLWDGIVSDFRKGHLPS